MTQPILTIEGLDVDYHVPRGAPLRALTDFDLTVGPGETVGVVGESGCGKTSLLWSILRLLPANGEISGGHIRFRDLELTALAPREMQSVRGREIAMIFQDPLTSLNPTFTVGQQLRTVLDQHAGEGLERGDARKRIVDVLTSVGIPDAGERLALYPHEFSGGMRQRIVIAMALLLEPALILADEPTASLDVTLEAQSLELLKRLQQERGTSILFVSHDLGVVSEVCDRIVVMYAGRVVEAGSTRRDLRGSSASLHACAAHRDPVAPAAGASPRNDSRPRPDALRASAGLQVRPALPVRARCVRRRRARSAQRGGEARPLRARAAGLRPGAGRHRAVDRARGDLAGRAAGISAACDRRRRRERARRSSRFAVCGATSGATEA